MDAMRDYVKKHDRKRFKEINFKICDVLEKYIKKKIVGGKETNNPNPYSISNILKDIE